MQMIDEKFLEEPCFGSRQMMRWLRMQGCSEAQTGSTFDETFGGGGLVSKAQHLKTTSRT
jgi:hypothetical protein